MKKVIIWLVCLSVLLGGCWIQEFPEHNTPTNYQVWEGVVVWNWLWVCYGEFIAYKDNKIQIKNAFCKRAPYDCPHYFIWFEIGLYIDNINTWKISDLYFNKDDC